MHYNFSVYPEKPQAKALLTLPHYSPLGSTPYPAHIQIASSSKTISHSLIALPLSLWYMNLSEITKKRAYT